MRNLLKSFRYTGILVRESVSRLMVLVVVVGLLTGPAATSQATTLPNRYSPPTAPVARQQGTAAAQAPLVTEFDVNGLKVLIKKRSSSQTVSAGLFFRGGTSNTTAQNAGIEGMMLDAAAEASTHFTREQVHAELSRQASAITGTAGLDYSALVMGSTASGFPRTWEIFTDLAINPKFDPADLKRLKDVRLAALRAQTTVPESYIEDLQSHLSYVGHPYLNGPAGTIESISRLTVSDLKQYHKKMLQSSRMLLVVVGDVDTAALRTQVEASFGRLPKGNYQPAAPPALSFAGPTVEVTARTLPTNYIQAIYAAPALTSPDIYAMTIANEFLQSFVYQEVRVVRNLSYAPDAFIRTQGANVGGISVTAVEANRAVGVMLDQINLMQENQLREEVVERVANSYLTKYYMEHETNGEQVGELAEYELIGGGWRNSLNTFEKLRQVTSADIQRVMRKYVRNLQFVVIGDPNAINKEIFTRPSAG